MLEPEDIRLLTEAGFLAAGSADVVRAERIFGALLRVRPRQAFAHVGQATALINAGRPYDAARWLAAADVTDGEEADMVGAFQGLALQLDRRPHEAESILRMVRDRVRNNALGDGARLAERLLGLPSGIAPRAG